MRHLRPRLHHRWPRLGRRLRFWLWRATLPSPPAAPEALAEFERALDDINSTAW